MHQVEQLAAQVLEGLHRFLGAHVHRGPVVVVRAALHQCQVEAAEALADLAEAGEVARVAAVEDALAAALDRP